MSIHPALPSSRSKPPLLSDLEAQHRPQTHSRSFSFPKPPSLRPSSSSSPSVFSLSPPDLAPLIDPKSIKLLSHLGGPDSLCLRLASHPSHGIPSLATIPVRKAHFGPNSVPEKPSKSLWQLMWLALQDKVLIVLIFAAMISLGLGLYTTFGTPPKTFQDANGNTVTEPQVDWVEGVAILAAVAIVTIVGSVNDYQKELQFKKLNAQKEDRSIKVVRCGGVEQVLPIAEIVVGDVVLVNAGDVLPVDGIFLEGYEVKCDESSVTGESDLIKKVTYTQALQIAREKTGQTGDGPLQTDVLLGKTDCFMVSGSKVVEGYGRYLVTAVGQNSFYGKIMMSLRGDTENTPLQTKLNTLAELIAKLGATAGLLLFVALMIRFFVQLKTDPARTASEKAQSFIQVLIISVTVIVVAVPEGLPLAVTLALAFATRRMTKMNLLVRVLSSCETMANATVVCTDKTGTLTQNKMEIVAGSIGVSMKFAAQLSENEQRVNVPKENKGALEQDKVEEQKEELGSDQQGSDGHSSSGNLQINIISDDDEPVTPQSLKMNAALTGRLDFSVDQAAIGGSLSAGLKKLFNDSIAINSTAFEAVTPSGSREFIGSKTETALLSFAKQQAWPDYHEVRERAEIVQMIPFSSQRKAMGVVVRLPNSNTYRLYLKGASEVLTKLTSHYVCVPSPGAEKAALETELVEAVPFDPNTRANISRTIIFYANQSLRTIALCYRDFSSWPPSHLGVPSSNDHVDSGEKKAGEVAYEELVGSGEGLTLLSVVAIEDPLRPGVAEAVAECARAGVAVKMVTGDNIITAKSIATQCGIYTPGGIIMEGPIFRQLTKREMIEIVPRLQVLARSSPEDKKRLVSYLKFIGEVCAVTGDGTNDGPALKAAHVGFSMGIAGTEVAKEASDIILMDDNFSSIVSAIMWGRCVNDSVKKFLQFQLSVNITAVVITFVTSIASSSETSILTAVQLLWVNLIMDTFAALALATDPASPKALNRKPDHQSANLINLEMWKMIIGQSIYQLIVILILNFAGKQILGLDSGFTDEASQIRRDDEHKTLVFNAFVWCQIWNLFNSRVLDRSLNVFKGMMKNIYFLVIFAIMLGGQVLIVEVGGAAFQVTKIGIRDWLISIIVGLISLPLGVLIKFVPTEPIGKLVYGWGWMRDPSKLELEMVDLDEVDDDDENEDKDGKSSEWNPAIDKVRDNLAMFSQIRGGRMRSSSFVRRSRHYMMKEKGIHTGALMTMVPTLVMTSIGAGWQPRNQAGNVGLNKEGSLGDPAAGNLTRSTSRLWTDKVEVHPDTEADDPVRIKFGRRKSKKESLTINGNRSGGLSGSGCGEASVTTTTGETVIVFGLGGDDEGGGRGGRGGDEGGGKGEGGG